MDTERIYDSTADTLAHIDRVRELLGECRENLRRRGVVHDASKLGSPEKEIFDRVTPRLRGMTYGSEEYRASLEEMKPALAHHYANNSHHPEHYEDGISGMDLFDLVEMLMDWKAATERHADGDIRRSLVVNHQRFGMSDQLFRIFGNTVNRMWPGAASSDPGVRD